STPYGAVVQVIAAIKKNGIRRFTLLAQNRGTRVGIPIILPDMKPEVLSGTHLGMAAAILHDSIILWSVSGREGRLQEPKAKVLLANLQEVETTLAEIAKRWPDEKSILLMADETTTMQTVASVLSAT